VGTFVGSFSSTFWLTLMCMGTFVREGHRVTQAYQKWQICVHIRKSSGESLIAKLRTDL